MSRNFAYLRVSTDSQSTEQQLHVIENAGYKVQANRVVSETISGTKPALKREGFSRLFDRLEEGDTVICNKLDRLGRNNMDLQHTVNVLTESGVHVVCLDLPVSNLSSSEGKLMLQLFATFAEFERNRISERTKDALAKKRANGVKLGRPKATGTREIVQEYKARGISQGKVVKAVGLSLSTVKRHWNVN